MGGERIDGAGTGEIQPVTREAKHTTPEKQASAPTSSSGCGETAQSKRRPGTCSPGRRGFSIRKYAGDGVLLFQFYVVEKADEGVI
jgi:hypothetical protein